MAVDAQLGRATVAIRATMDKLDADLAKARGQVDSAVGRIARSAGEKLQTIGKLALGGIGVATGAVAGLGAALGKLAIDAAPVEGLSQAFEGLAESAGIGADEMMAALRRGSAGMVSQRDLMMSFNQAAQLVSTDFAVQLPDAMQYLSKVSASTGQDMGFMLDSLVKGVGRLSPMILDNLGIQVNLSQATERAAEMFGVQADELSKSQVQAGMMNVVLEKLAENTAAMPDVTESASARLAQFKAGIQDAKDRIGMAMLPALSSLIGTFTELGERVLPPVMGFIEGTVAPIFEKAATVVGDFFWMLDAGIEPVNAFKIALAEMFGPEVADTVMNIVEQVRQFIATAQEALAPVMEWISQNTQLSDVLIALGAAIASVIVPALISIVSAAAPVIGVFIAVVAIVAALRAAWESNFLGIRDIAANVWGWLKEFIPQAIQTISDIVQTVVQAITDFWAQHGESIMTKAQEIWDTVLSIFEFFKGQFTTLFEAFSLAFQGDWRGFGEKLREFWDTGWEKIKEIGSKAWEAIKSFFTNTDWGAVGRAILDGIANGIKAGAAAVADAAKAAARAALDAAKGFLGIHSPSSLAASVVGEPFAEGIGAGILGSMPDLRRAAQRLSSELLRVSELSMTMNLGGIEREAAFSGGRQQIIIYGLTLQGVQDKAGLLAELQALT